jgi:hypothetical protein
MQAETLNIMKYFRQYPPPVGPDQASIIPTINSLIISIGIEVFSNCYCFPISRKGYRISKPIFVLNVLAELFPPHFNIVIFQGVSIAA